MSTNFQPDDVPHYEPETHGCAKCGGEMEWADCWMIDCEDGYYDIYDEDPVNNSPGDMATCQECGGRGGWWFCRSCERAAETQEVKHD